MGKKLLFPLSNNESPNTYKAGASGVPESESSAEIASNQEIRSSRAEPSLNPDDTSMSRSHDMERAILLKKRRR